MFRLLRKGVAETGSTTFPKCGGDGRGRARMGREPGIQMRGNQSTARPVSVSLPAHANSVAIQVFGCEAKLHEFVPESFVKCLRPNNLLPLTLF